MHPNDYDSSDAVAGFFLIALAFFASLVFHPLRFTKYLYTGGFEPERADIKFFGILWRVALPFAFFFAALLSIPLLR